MGKKICGYEIEQCTAIAECDDENEACRQDTLLLVSASDSGEKFEFLVFGWDMPNTEEDFNDMLDDPSAWEQLADFHRCKK